MLLICDCFFLELQTDFKSHFKLIEENRYMMYCKAFAKVDKENNEFISVEVCRNIWNILLGVRGIWSKRNVQSLSKNTVSPAMKWHLPDYCLLQYFCPPSVEAKPSKHVCRMGVAGMIPLLPSTNGDKCSSLASRTKK